MEKIYNVLFLSRRNSARSLMAELVLNRHGRGKFRAFSAGVEPSPNVDPIALDVLRQAGYATDGLQPKHWRKLSGRDGPILDSQPERRCPSGAAGRRQLIGNIPIRSRPKATSGRKSEHLVWSLRDSSASCRYSCSFPSARSSPWLSRRDWASWDRPAVRSAF
jgi:Low molecular weight phosphotyrosine protein phosphatase